MGLACIAAGNGIISSSIYVGQTLQNGGHVTIAGVTTTFAVGAGLSVLGKVISSKISDMLSKGSTEEVSEEVAKKVTNGVSNAVDLGKDELVVADKSFLDASGRIDWEKYAPNGGYIAGTKVEGATLDVGKIIDRYGNPRGSYTSPVGVPYGQRALPYIENPNAYHQYEVIKNIDNVSMGEIAQAFNQPGGGIQYELPNSIEYLIKNGYLKELK